MPEREDEEELGALRSVAGFLRPYYLRHAGSLGVITLCVLAEALYNVAFPLSLKYLIDDALLPRNKNALIWIVVVLAGLALAISGAAFVLEYLNARLSAAVLFDLRERLFGHLQSLSVEYFGRSSAGEVISRFSTDVGEIEDAVRYWVSQGLTPASELAAAVAMLFWLNWRLALAAMLIWPLTLVGPRIVAPRAMMAVYRKKQLEAEALGVIEENIAGQTVVKAFGLQGIARGWFRQRSEPLAAISTRVNFLSAVVERLVSTAVLLLHVLIVGFGAWLAFHKRITVGTLVSFENVFWELSYNIGCLSQFLPEAIQAGGAIRHVRELLDEEPRIEDAPGAVVLPGFSREILFENVSFGYGGEPGLQNLSLRIPRGSKTVLAGPSGSGKSTVLSLILRLHDPRDGQIRIDGRDLRSVTRESLRAQMAVVFQESFLFNATIGDNIRLGKPGATDEDVRRAAKSAEIHDFVVSLPQGYDTMAGERGGRMSGGQRQRIALARALVRDPAILILDEATSALDEATAAAVLATLRRVSVGRTVITATHRLETMADADVVILLEQGRVRTAGVGV